MALTFLAVLGALAACLCPLAWASGLSFIIPIIGAGCVGLYLVTSLRFVAKDEQVFAETLTSLEVVNGPRVCVLPLLTRKSWKKKAVSLGTLEYCVVDNSLTGEARVEKGPKLLFLEPYDEIKKGKGKVISLSATEYIRFLDVATGTVRLEIGEQGCIVPGVNEVVVGPGKQQAIDLKCYEYVKLEDKKTGAVRVERGEQLVFPGVHEEVVGGDKQRAVEVDEETAVLVRDKRSGQQLLVRDKSLYFPSADEEILSVQKLIKLADHEACIVRGKDGKDVIYFGKDDAQRSFFLPPHSSLVELLWSRGRRRERRDLRISKIDLRPMFMSFEFNCRTADNVELVLEGSFFWEVVDLAAMNKFTNDTTGDICNHARSSFIERVSKVTLQHFMGDFNQIAASVGKEDTTNFYSQRGVKIHSLEVTGYRCAEERTASTLREIIKETTNRMNRLQQQESENEVQLAQIKGDIDEELARSELLKVQTENKKAVSEMEGLGEAQRVRSFLLGLEKEVPDLKMRMQAWQVLRKREALHELGQSNASTKLYFTPSDVNLSIETHEHGA